MSRERMIVERLTGALFGLMAGGATIAMIATANDGDAWGTLFFFVLVVAMGAFLLLCGTGPDRRG